MKPSSLSAATLRTTLGTGLSVLALLGTAEAGQIRWQSGTVMTEARSAEEIGTLLGELSEAAEHDQPVHAVVQFNGPPSRVNRARIEAAGVRLLHYLGDDAYFVSVRRGVDSASIARLGVATTVEPIRRAWKLHWKLAAGEIPQWAVVRDQPTSAQPTESPEPGMANPIIGVYVSFHADVVLLRDGAAAVRRHGGRVRDEIKTVNALVVELAFADLAALADEDTVRYLEPALPKMSELNDSNRELVGAESVHSPPYGLDGRGIGVLVYDGGRAFAGHVDFAGRLTARDTDTLSDHATHVSGTIGGNGAAAGGLYKGMAPAVRMESYGFEHDGSDVFLYSNPGDLEHDYDEAINVYGVDLANNSIGSNVRLNGFPCDITGDYGVTSELIDAIVAGRLGAPFRSVWANGNERGTPGCTSTSPGGYHSTAPPACAKNHITVGAVHSNSDAVTNFTSWGPADDGRLKPDLAGPGCQSNGDLEVTSCSSSGPLNYDGKCGTSMASPTVCGISALLLQDYRAQFPGEPDFRNSTLKILLAHTAVDLEAAGPDFKTGYGSVRIKPAIDFMRSGNFLEGEVEQGQSYGARVFVEPGQAPLKVTLAWDDEPATGNVIPALVNDLDLIVQDPGGHRHSPWTLDPANPSAPAARSQEDHLNNIEQVVVDLPGAGLWSLEIRGTNVPFGPQSFSLSASPQLLNCSSRGAVRLDRMFYSCSAVISVRVVDCDLNALPETVESVSVGVSSVTDRAGEMVLLTETGPDTADFRGSVPTAPARLGGTVGVEHLDTVTAAYLDADDGAGGRNVIVTDLAGVDCVAPVIADVEVTDVLPTRVNIEFVTSEHARGTVRYATSCDQLTSMAGVALFRTAHSVPLVDLADGTTYFFALDAEDVAGNQTTDDAGGGCHSFMTPQAQDFFTELFNLGENDVTDRTYQFTPDGSLDFYAVCTTPTCVLPVDPSGGAALPLTDDDSETVTLSGGAQVWFYGVAYTQIHVGSNGYLTFDTGDSDATESIADHFDQIRISALFDDLNPVQGGSVRFEQLADRAVVTWDRVPQDNLADANTFQVELFFDGAIRLSRLGIGATDGLIGLSPGADIPTGFFETDLTDAASCGPQAPTAGDLSVVTAQNRPVTFALAGCDEGEPKPSVLDYVIDSLPQQALVDQLTSQVIQPADLPYTLADHGRDVQYVPGPIHVGIDQFGYHATDNALPPAGGASNQAVVRIRIDPVLAPPFADGFAQPTFDPDRWFLVETATLDGTPLHPPSPPLALRLDGLPDGGDQIQTHLFDLSGHTSVEVTYAFERTGGGDSPETGDDLFVEYWGADGTWKLLQRHFGTEPDMTAFQGESVFLPVDGLHANFRLRFRNTASTGAFDDWFVDDVVITIIDAPIAQDVLVAAPADVTTAVVLTSTDPNGRKVSTTVESLPAHAKLRDPAGGVIQSVPYELLDGGNVVRLRPAFGYHGPDQFTFRVSNGSQASNLATVHATIGGPQPLVSFPLDTQPGWSLGGGWAFGAPQGAGSHNHDPAGGFTGQNVFGYNLAGDYPNSLGETHFLTTTALDCTDRMQTQLRFRRWLGIESATYDHAQIDVSNDLIRWTNVWTHSGALINEAAWSLQAYDISAVADDQPVVYVRWGLGPTDGSVTYPGWNLDDVEIWGLRSTVIPDFDSNGVIGLADFAQFHACFTGPDQPLSDDACTPADLDGDADVDLSDLRIFQLAFTVE